MRLFSYEAGGVPRVGVVVPQDDAWFYDAGDLVAGLPGDMTALLAMPGALVKLQAAMASASGAERHSFSKARLLPVVPRPGKIVCMGLNYLEHAKEGGNAPPEYPAIFMRGATSQVAHGEPIVRPKVSSKLDYEAELAVVIGERARHLTPENALACIAGYSIYNDASVRDYQRKSAQWTMGKNFDATGAFGPCLVTPDDIPEGAVGLRIQSRLNGNIMQDGNTSDLIWSVAETLAIITECMTLEPGDVVITGTPAGVGYARKPPVWLTPGDTCEVEIEGIGVLSNPIVDET